MTTLSMKEEKLCYASWVLPTVILGIVNNKTETFVQIFAVLPTACYNLKQNISPNTNLTRDHSGGGIKN